MTDRLHLQTGLVRLKLRSKESALLFLRGSGLHPSVTPGCECRGPPCLAPLFPLPPIWHVRSAIAAVRGSTPVIFCGAHALQPHKRPSTPLVFSGTRSDTLWCACPNDTHKHTIGCWTPSREVERRMQEILILTSIYGKPCKSISWIRSSDQWWFHPQNPKLKSHLLKFSMKEMHSVTYHFGSQTEYVWEQNFPNYDQIHKPESKIIIYTKSKLFLLQVKTYLWFKISQYES